MIKRLLSFVKPFKLKLTKAIIFGTLGHIFALCVTLGMASSVVALVLKPVFLSFYQGIILSITCAFLRAFCRYIEQKANHDIAFRILSYIRNTVFSTLRVLAPAKLEVKDKGSIISMITGDIELLEVFYAHTLSPLVIAFLTSIIFSIYLFFINPYFALISMLSYINMSIVLPRIMGKRLTKQSDIQRNKLAHITSLTTQVIDTRYEIKQYNKEKKYITIIEKESENLVKEQEKSIRINSLNQALISLSVLLFSSLVLVTGLFLNVSIEKTIIATVFMLTSFGPSIALSQLANVLPLTFASAKRVFSLIDEKPCVEEIVNKNDVVLEKEEAKNVYFGYDKDKIILNNINLKIEKNSIIGIKGDSGSGKSTLIKLLLRFYDCDKGSININNLNINQINSENLRDNISYFTQQSMFFSTSILENIRIGKENASLEEVRNVCKLCNIDQEIMSLDKNYETVLDFKNLTLSSGQLQRISLARCIIGDSKLLVLDEPTSNIDSLSEAIILDTLTKIKKDKIILLVSHRESSLKKCDKIINFEDLSK